MLQAKAAWVSVLFTYLFPPFWLFPGGARVLNNEYTYEMATLG